MRVVLLLVLAQVALLVSPPQPYLTRVVNWNGKCPVCQLEGRLSTVTVGSSHTTLAYSPPFYDEQGRLHYHDPNGHTTYYRCSRGHDFYEVRITPCPWGDYPEVK